MEILSLEKNIFELTWFGKNLNKNSGIKLWEDNDFIVILNQPAYKLEKPINWLDDPYKHRSWCWIFNAFQWMDQLLARYKLDGDIQAIQKCAEYFLEWINFYIVNDRTGEFLWKDDAVSFRTFRIAIIARYIFESDLYSNDEKQLVEEVLVKHYVELSDIKKFKKNNHGIFQVRALMSLVTLHPLLGDRKVAQDYVTERLNWLWHKQYGKQNIHLENSTGYHQYIIKEFHEILNSPELFGFNFSFRECDIEEVKQNSKFLFHPNGIGTLFGDSNYVQQSHDIVTGDHLFNEAGYAFLAGNSLNENNSYLAIRTGFPSNAHRHSDDFSFEWSEFGKIILQDSGRHSYDYESPFRKFVTSSLAHNTVTVNGENFPWWGSFSKDDFYEGAIKRYHSSDKYSFLELEKDFYSLDLVFNRKIEFSKGESLFVVDELNSKITKEFIQWFHFAEDFIVNFDASTKNILVLDGGEFFIEIHSDSDIQERLVLSGQTTPYYQGWISYSEKKIIPRWTVGLKKIGSNIKFSTRLVVVMKEE